MWTVNGSQLIHEIGAQLGGTLEKALFLEDRQGFQGHRSTQRIAAKSRRAQDPGIFLELIGPEVRPGDNAGDGHDLC